MRRYQGSDEETEVNITPMLDIVFILLIFFIVTTSFVREKGLDISRPTQAEEQIDRDEEKLPILVRINQISLISMNNRRIEPDAVRANLERERAQNPEAALIVAAHPDADVNALVRVLDAAKVVGIASISVATESQSL